MPEEFLHNIRVNPVPDIRPDQAPAYEPFVPLPLVKSPRIAAYEEELAFENTDLVEEQPEWEEIKEPEPEYREKEIVYVLPHTYQRV